MGLLSAINTSLNRPVELPDIKRDIKFSGVVTGEECYPDFKKLFIDIDKILLKNDTVDYNIPVEFFSYYQEKTLLGRRVIIRGRIRDNRASGFRNIMVGSIVGSYPDDNFLSRVFYHIRNYIETLFKKLFSPQNYDIATGFILGGSSRLAKSMKDIFRSAGVLHILAVSGLHIGFVIVFLSSLLIFIPIDNRIKFLIIMVGLFVYAGITGFRPSVCRAGIMAFLFGLGLVLQRNVEPLHIINITAIAFLLVNPLLFFDVGTELSFAAVYGILILYPQFEEFFLTKFKKRFIKTIMTLMVVSLSAQLFVLPLVSYYFHRVPTLAVFSNILIIPLASIIIFVLYMCILSSLVFIPLARVCGYLVSLLNSVLIHICNFFALIPGSVIFFIITPTIFLLYYLLFFKKTRFIGVVLLLVMLNLQTVASFSEAIIIKRSPYGLLITTPAQEHIFITDKKRSLRLKAFLDYQGIRELDYLIAPEKFYRVKKEFIEMVDGLHFKKIGFGRLQILLSRKFRLEFDGKRILQDWNDVRNSDSDSMEYIVANSRHIFRFRDDIAGSIFDRLLIEIRMLWAQISTFNIFINLTKIWSNKPKNSVDVEC